MKSSISNVNYSMTQSGLFTWLNPYHKLETRISALAQESFRAEHRADLRRGIELAHSWMWPTGRMQKVLSMLPKEMIKAFVLDLMATGCDKEIDYYCQKCLALLNEKLLQDLSGMESSDAAAKWFHLQNKVKSKALETGLAKESHAILKEFLVEFNYCIHHLLEMLVSISGLNELSRQKRNKFEHSTEMSSFEANSKLEIYLKLIALPATIFGFIYSYTVFKTPAILLTSFIIIGSLAALLAYNRYWKPCPIDQPGLKNLSIDLLRENNPVYPRRDILSQIEAAFRAKKGVILVGEPGVGKSWIVRSFVEQVSAGKVCAFIKKPQVFSCNGASFDPSYDGISFTSIEERFKRHRDQIVLFIDEFHSLFMANRVMGNSSTNQIKTFCEDFKYVIGATTQDEFDEHVKEQKAIVERRFRIITVKAMDEPQLKIALSKHLGSQGCNIGLEDGILDEIIKEAKGFNSGTSLVDAAFSLLNSAIDKMKAVANRELEKEIIQLEDQQEVIEQEIVSGVSSLSMSRLCKLENDLTNIQSLLQSKKTELNQYTQRIKRLQKMEALYLKVERQCYKMALPNAPASREWVTLQARRNLMKEFIKIERVALSLPRCLDKELLKSILKEKR